AAERAQLEMATSAWPIALDAMPPPLRRGLAEFSDLFGATDWPSVADLDRLRKCVEARDRRIRPAFVAQTSKLLADGLHYETRIAERGELATRERNSHDLYNALIWLRHPELKWALNARQVADVARVGPKARTRGQCALTHFDEAGVIVWIADEQRLAAWDRHDWSELFLTNRAGWGRDVAVTVFGHALLDHATEAEHVATAKAIAVWVDRNSLKMHITHETGHEFTQSADSIIPFWAVAERQLATAIRAGDLLADPQHLRPLPLAGIPGWHPENAEPGFFCSAPCFRPLRPGRTYPPPFAME
ncbi:MAG: DUF3025 domain-containing protein, partial [Dokdonella sp.]